MNAVEELIESSGRDVRANTVGHTFERIAAVLETSVDRENSLVVAAHSIVKDKDNAFD